MAPRTSRRRSDVTAPNLEVPHLSMRSGPRCALQVGEMLQEVLVVTRECWGNVLSVV